MIALILAMEIGFIPFGVVNLYEIEQIPTWYAQIELGMKIEHFYLKSMINTLSYREGRMFIPNTVMYGVEGGFQFKGLRAGYRHLCTHPIVPFFNVTSGVIIGDAGADVFFVRYTNE